LLLIFKCFFQYVFAGFFKEKTAKTLSPFEKGGTKGGFFLGGFFEKVGFCTV
jgi:hypothetical protein